MKQQYNIFISYRRKETADKAEHLFTLLEHNGYRDQVSFDRENLDGRFDIEILRRLDCCTDFIVVLAAETLSSLKYEDTEWYKRLAQCTTDEFPAIEAEMKAAGRELDFVRFEIARAITQNKHIIPLVPVATSDYNFDELKLPEDICQLKKMHAEKYQDTKDFLFKDILPKIMKRLKSRSGKYRFRMYAIIFMILLIVVMGLVLLTKWNGEKDAFESCHTKSDYELCAEHSFFFRSNCEDSIAYFRKLTTRTTPVNDACNTGSKDSIRIKWSDDCSLLQLRVLRKMINSMMYVEKGTFTMGSAEPLGLEDYEHEVEIDKDFYIGKFEVTELEWNVIMSDSVAGNGKLPVTEVSWDDCQIFIRKLQTMTGLMFALPTEAQWEYAAKKNGEKGWVYAGSDEPHSVAVFEETSEGKAEDVDLKKPNGLELYNMSGNVSEWCLDGGESKKRIRGGSYQSAREEITVTYSDAATTGNKSKTVGLRLVINN